MRLFFIYTVRSKQSLKKIKSGLLIVVTSTLSGNRFLKLCTYHNDRSSDLSKEFFSQLFQSIFQSSLEHSCKHVLAINSTVWRAGFRGIHSHSQKYALNSGSIIYVS